MSKGRYFSVRKYECAIVLAPNVGSDGVENSTTKYKEIITSRGGELVAFDDWGKRSLAYEVNYHREGYYHFYRFSGGKDVVDELNRQLRIDENVIRHIIIRDEQKPAPVVAERDRGAAERGKEGE
jgi:small subunit ribosomal protein S6